jgi:large subunit ribosomal protein L24
MNTLKIKKGDTVRILTGKDRGKSGKVSHADPRGGRVTLENLNLFKKHVKPRKQGEKGEMVQVPRPVRISNVALVCPSCGKATRIGVRREKNVRVRFCRKCGASI